MRLAVALLVTLGVAAGALLVAGHARAAVTWTNDTAVSGISFLHAGDDGRHSFLEVVNGGACWGDFDGDGYVDLYLTNTRYNVSSMNDLYDPHDQLFRNNGDGTFTDVTATMGLIVRHYGTGCSVADYDNDGRPDIFVTAYGENTLLHNDGDFHFHNATLAANVSSIGKCGAKYPCWGTGSAWADVNGDGCLDLYVGDFVEYLDSEFKGDGPGYYDGQTNLFFQNNCDGTFTERTAAYNLSGSPSHTTDKTHMVSFLDVNRDGRPDILVSNDECPLQLFEQLPNGTYQNVIAQLGINDSLANMGLAVDDVNGDALPDFLVTHYYAEGAGYYVEKNDGTHTYTDRSSEGDLANLSNDVGWGAGFVDVNADGFPDLFVFDGGTSVGGQILPYNEERFLFAGDGTGAFHNITATSGAPWAKERSIARGGSYADVDFDGNLDFVIANTGNQSAEYLHGHGNTNHWLQILLRDPGRNRFGVGAEVSVTPDGSTFTATRIVHAGDNYVSQPGPYQYFGLGKANGATLSVRWADGGTSTWHFTGANETLRLTRGDAKIATDTLAPRTTISFDLAENAGWFTASPTVTLTSVDRAAGTPSGVATTEYRVDGGAWQNYTGPFNPGLDGRHTLEYRAIDGAGNEESIRSRAVNVDSTPPVTSLDVLAPGNDGWFNAGSRVDLEATDDLSGVFAVQFRVAGGNWTLYQSPFPLTGAGAVKVEYRAFDAAGNLEATRNATFTVDVAPPTTVLSFDGPALLRIDRVDITNTTTMPIAATDATSGVVHSEYRISGGPWTPYTAPLAFDGADGLRLVEYRSEDAAGNVEPTNALELFLDDHTPPAIAFDAPKEATIEALGESADTSPLTPFASGLGTHPLTAVAGPIDVRATAGPDVSGVAWTSVYIDGVERTNVTGGDLAWTWDTTLELPGWHDVEIRTADGLGNVGVADRYVLT
ncbi:MAG: CRTAC1 family protein [Thermoplasmatota archaeon]